MVVSASSGLVLVLRCRCFPLGSCLCLLRVGGGVLQPMHTSLPSRWPSFCQWEFLTELTSTCFPPSLGVSAPRSLFWPPGMLRGVLYRLSSVGEYCPWSRFSAGSASSFPVLASPFSQSGPSRSCSVDAFAVRAAARRGQTGRAGPSLAAPRLFRSHLYWLFPCCSSGATAVRLVYGALRHSSLARPCPLPLSSSPLIPATVASLSRAETHPSLRPSRFGGLPVSLSLHLTPLPFPFCLFSGRLVCVLPLGCLVWVRVRAVRFGAFGAWLWWLPPLVRAVHCAGRCALSEAVPGHRAAVWRLCSARGRPAVRAGERPERARRAPGGGRVIAPRCPTPGAVLGLVPSHLFPVEPG